MPSSPGAIAVATAEITTHTTVASQAASASAGREEAIHTFVDENGDLQYYTFNMPALQEAEKEPSKPGATVRDYSRSETPQRELLNGVPTSSRTSVPDFHLALNRMLLLDLLDRNEYFVEVPIQIVIAAITAFLAYLIHPFYDGFGLVMLWFTVAGAHYSLLKSPLPDGFSYSVEPNLLAPLSRAIYLCLAASVAWWLSVSIGRLAPYPFDLGSYTYVMTVDAEDSNLITVFGYSFDQYSLLVRVHWALLVLILSSPLFYTTTLLPSFNTCLYVFLEQMNITALGSSGAASIFAAMFDFFRALFICGVTSAVAVEWAESYLTLSLSIAFLVALTYLNSRVTCDPFALWPTVWQLTRAGQRFHFPSLSDFFFRSAYPPTRLLWDLVTAVIILVFVFVMHSTRLFYVIVTYVPILPVALALIVGVPNHLLLPRLREAYPFLVFQRPFLRNRRDVSEEFLSGNQSPHVAWYEVLGLCLTVFEKLLYTAMFVCAINDSMPFMADKFGYYGGVFLNSLVSLKLFNITFRDTSAALTTILFDQFFFSFDAAMHSETPILDLYLSSIIMAKLRELIAKVNFMAVYSAPWKLSWGSAFHAVMHFLCIPHFPFFVLQFAWSALVASPLIPLFGSVWFTTSYTRPVKFWESSIRTEMAYHSQLKLSEALDIHDKSTAQCDAIFYENLLLSLQEALECDREAGRFGDMHTGDIYLILNDMLTAFIHIIHLGNGHVTFQIRGLEFKGTICQERELAAVNAGDFVTDTFCCLRQPRFPFPRLMRIKDIINFRWNTWKIINTNYILPAYSVALLPASNMFNLFSLRRILITKYVQSLVFYVIRSPSLVQWLSNEDLLLGLEMFHDGFADIDTLFHPQIDEDYDVSVNGITLSSFSAVFGGWVDFCVAKQKRT
eukprot:TRINITY_DN1217_c0_g1_i5.p1 TRINITY_DN1217_c0_g1~~TRINITY_DN1217_c0_g1_i5.p1  ORF type:complete len:898 (+),score=189.30 TRINITY_DN1217_c0_g1_i5:1201-3894(+)